MARAMWKGSIAFGLVNIPIELYGAVRDHRPKFRLLHATDESPVHYERVKPKLTERETPHQAEVVDLMTRLRASLEGKGQQGGTARRPDASKTKKKAPKRKRVA